MYLRKILSIILAVAMIIGTMSTVSFAEDGVAKINSEFYDTLKEAVDAAAAGDTIELLSDVEVASNETITLDGVNLTAAEGVTLTVNGTFDVYGESTLSIPKMAGEETINFCDGAIISESNIAGNVFVAGNVTFRGENTFAMLYDFGKLTDYYGTTADMEWTVEEGGSVTLTSKTRYGLGYGDNVTVNGRIDDASAARESLTADDASLFMHGLIGQENAGWNQNSSIAINNAYVIIGSNSSFGNASGNKYGGTYTYDINNSVVDASRITFYEASSKSTFNITNSDVNMGTFMTNDTDSVFNLTNSKVVSTTPTNGTDVGNYNAGTLNVVNSELVYSAPVTNNGTITVDIESTITAPAITGTGTIEIDVSNYNGYGDPVVIDADLSGFTGEVKAVGGEAADVTIVDGKIVYDAAPVGGPVIGYTSTNSIWGETRANAKESYVIKVYSGETFLGQSSLNNIGGIIDGDLAPTWRIELDAASNTDEYWDMSWDIAPSMEYQPTHVALVVDGKEVSRTPIQLNGPDNLNKIYAAVTDADGKILSYATSLENAFANVKDGGTIELLRSVVLEAPISFAKDMTITLDGNGYTIKPSDDFSSSVHLLELGSGNKDTVATRKYTIKDVVFEDIKTEYGVRLQGVDATVNDCTFINANQLRGHGLLNLTACNADVSGCVFQDNICVTAIDINYNGGSGTESVVSISECVFDNNDCSRTGVIYYVDGKSLTVSNCEFTNNEVTTAGNGATLYAGYNYNITIKDNLFENNTVKTTVNASTIAGAVFAGVLDNKSEISGNVFKNNSAYNVDVSSGIAQSVLMALWAYDGDPSIVSGNLNENYWEDGRAPVEGVDYTTAYYSGANDFSLISYYAELDENGNPTSLVYDIDDMASVGKKVVLEQVMNGEEPTDKVEVYLEGEYNGEDAIINNLVAAEIDFVVTGDFAITGFEVADTNWTSEITANGSYLIREKGAEDGAADITGKKILLGTITLEGYGNGTIAAAANYGAVQQRTADGEHVVVSTVANAYTLPFAISVPRKDLTVTIDFNNAVEKKAVAYQDMTVIVSGGDLAEEIEIKLGNEAQNVSLTLDSKPGANYTVDAAADNKYTVNVADALTVNTTYTVTAKGAGYRTIRKNVTMTDDMTVNFWNNVKDDLGADYLAGDIVKDNTINIYDLSAVVSYFGTTNDTTAYSTYAKYDLNRDGKIDSKDVAYVLVSWGK